MIALPHTISNGDALDAAPIMANFNALRDKFGAISNEDIAATAAIDPKKLASRFLPDTVVIQLVPITSNAALDSAARAAFTVATSWSTLHKHRVDLRSGQEAWLCAAELYTESTVQTGGNIEIQILVDGVVLTGAAAPITSSPDYRRVGNTNSFDTPLLPVQDGTVIEFQVKASAGTPTILGVTARLDFKKGLLP